VIEREPDGVGNAGRLERGPGCTPDDARGVAIERVGGTVGRLGPALEEIEERWAAGADDQGARRAGQEVGQAQRRGRPVERRG
jgi:hypothetical protein